MFAIVLACCWGLGLFGLEGGRTSSISLGIIGLAGLLVFRAMGAVKRRIEGPHTHLVVPARVTPRTCIVLGRFGDEDEPAEGDAARVDGPSGAELN